MESLTQFTGQSSSVWSCETQTVTINAIIYVDFFKLIRLYWHS